MAESPRSRAGMDSRISAKMDGPARTESTKKDGNTTIESITYNQPTQPNQSVKAPEPESYKGLEGGPADASVVNAKGEQLWAKYNSQAAAGMSQEEKDIAKAWAAANGHTFEGTITQKATGPLIEDPNYQTAGVGGVDPSLTDGDKGDGSGGDSGGDKDKGPSSAAGDLADANPKETNRYTNSMMGIWDAFREGKIDKGTALYFTLDSIAKLARNTGKDLNNIAAAFTGGTIDNEREDSLWSQRRNKMFENELASEVESQYGSPAWRSKMHDLNSLSMEDKNLFAKDIENWIADNTKGLTKAALAEQLRAMGLSNDVTEAMNWLKLDLRKKADAGDKTAIAALKTLDGLNTVATPVVNTVNNVKNTFGL
jgi:hypothetical protein